MKDVTKASRIVVKVGTSTLTHANGLLNFRRIDELARVLSDLKNEGKKVVLVSSGAIGVGAAKLGMNGKPHELKEKQAAAAVGQCELMHIYDKMFQEYGQTVAQVLLTRDVTDTPERHQHVVNTMDALLEHGAIPVINENDTVAVEEIVYGDNDTLSAIVAEIAHADLLVLLSDIDGLYDEDPHKNEGACLIPVVYELTDKIRAAAGGVGTEFGSGGMATKIQAADIALAAGIPMIIANGARPDVLYEIFEGKQVGTVFLP